MAKSTLKRMRTFSGILFLIFVAAMFIAVHDFRQGRLGAGFLALAVASYAIAALFGFALPTICRIETTTRGACRRWAYGLLFGCSDVPGHRMAKLYARLHLQRQAVRAISPGRRQPGRAYATTRTAANPQNIVVTFTDSPLAKCGFWVGVVGTAAGVVAVILPLAGVR